MMNTAELKVDLISKITEVNDANIIEMVSKYLEFELSASEYKTTDEQKQRVAQGQADRVISEEDANYQINA